MNLFCKTIFITLTLFVSTQNLKAQENPNALLAKLSSAIEAKDLNAASALVDWQQAPVAAYRMFKMSMIDCFAPAKCKVEIAAISDEEKKPQLDFYYATIPEGKVKIISAGDNSESLSMPFAKVNGNYSIIVGLLNDKSYAETKEAADAHKIAEGIDADLVSSGQPLAEDGGEPAKAYREYLQAIAQGDTAFLARAGTSSDQYYFGKAYKDNAAKASVTLDLIRMESIPQPKIKAAFIKDNRAILLVSGVSGQGWITEGAVTLFQDSGKWVVEDKTYISYPPGSS